MSKTITLKVTPEEAEMIYYALGNTGAEKAEAMRDGGATEDEIWSPTSEAMKWFYLQGRKVGDPANIEWRNGKIQAKEKTE